MSILKSILSPFVDFKEDEAEAKKPVTPTSVEPAPVPSQGAQQATAPLANATTFSPATPGKYGQHFDELIEQANATNPLFKGTDFKEFIDSKIDVEGIADEASRYKTAFNVLKRTGLTKERLDSTGREYIKIIDQDLKAFDAVYQQQYKVNVEQKQQSLEAKTLELKALTDKIATLNNEIQQADKEIAQSRDQLTNNKNAFMLAGEQKKKEIENELSKINQYFS